MALIRSTTSLPTLYRSLLAYQALHKLVPGLVHLAGAAIAWQQVTDLFHAAAPDYRPID
jgi:hypothetical protein